MSFIDYVKDVMRAIGSGISSYTEVKEELDRARYISESRRALYRDNDAGRGDVSVVVPVLWGSF